MSDRRLAGLCVLVTRPQPQAEQLAARIRELEGEALTWPLLVIESFLDHGDATATAMIRDRFASLAQYDKLVFVSANAVREAMRWRDCLALQNLVLPPCFVIGEASAAALAQHGIRSRSGSGAMNSEALLDLPEMAVLDGQQLLLCRGQGGRSLLAESLRRRGAGLDECALYRRVCPDYAAGALASAIERVGVNVAQLGSGETLENFVTLLGPEAAGTIVETLTVLVPGQRVARMAQQHGCGSVLVAEQPTDEGLIRALQQYVAAGDSVQTESQ